LVFSVDLSEWFLLPPPQLEALRLAHHCTALFTGFPAHVATFQTPQVFFSKSHNSHRGAILLVEVSNMSLRCDFFSIYTISCSSLHDFTPYLL
jgi:hypothetical protein